MKLAKEPDPRKVDLSADEFAEIFKRVGTLIEMLGVFGAKCDEIYDQTSFAIDRYEDVRNGRIVKDSVSGQFVRPDFAR